MSTVRRRIGLMAGAAILLTLHAPLCALACLDTPAASEIAAHDAESPCHAEPPEPSPADDPGSHADCEGCGLARAALLPGSDTGTLLPHVALAPRGASQPAIRASASFAPAVSETTDLPPPDILLRKSTLLL